MGVGTRVALWAGGRSVAVRGTRFHHIRHTMVRASPTLNTCLILRRQQDRQPRIIVILRRSANSNCRMAILSRMEAVMKTTGVSVLLNGINNREVS